MFCNIPGSGADKCAHLTRKASNETGNSEQAADHSDWKKDSEPHTEPECVHEICQSEWKPLKKA